MLHKRLSGNLIRTKTILVVEDDEEIRCLLQVKLTRSGYEVLTASTGQDALARIAEHGLPHLALVDINMPVMGGLEFCERAKQFSDLPIIILTAIDEPQTVISAIEKFAEDYIVKPFNLGELMARIERVLNRFSDFGYVRAPLVQINPALAVEFGHHTATLNGKQVHLSPTETKLLYIFWVGAGRMLSNEFLLRRVWPTEEIYEDTLRVHISRLRKKIEGSLKGNCSIVAERGQGYRFIADLNKEYVVQQTVAT